MATDLFTLQGDNYLLMVDYLSKFPGEINHIICNYQSDEASVYKARNSRNIDQRQWTTVCLSRIPRKTTHVPTLLKATSKLSKLSPRTVKTKYSTLGLKISDQHSLTNRGKIPDHDSLTNQSSHPTSIRPTAMFPPPPPHPRRRRCGMRLVNTHAYVYF
jgi:hypothetical protein